MKRILFSVALWIVAIIITLFSVIYQRKTGPTYPISDQVTMDSVEISYELERSHPGPGDQTVEFIVPDTSISAVLVWRRYPTQDDWTRVPMQRRADTLRAALPHQPPAGKLEYHVELLGAADSKIIPKKENAVTRFRGDVPAWAMIPHILFMFFAMLVSTRAGLEALRANGRYLGLAIAASVLMFLGGMIFGPIVQKYAFGAFWTGFPFGTDLTDNKTLIAMIAWIAALIALWRNRRARGWVIAAAIVTLLIFMIPHSMHGSELDYSTLESTAADSVLQNTLD